MLPASGSWGQGTEPPPGASRRNTARHLGFGRSDRSNKRMLSEAAALVAICHRRGGTLHARGLAHGAQPRPGESPGWVFGVQRQSACEGDRQCRPADDPGRRMTPDDATSPTLGFGVQMPPTKPAISTLPVETRRPALTLGHSPEARNQPLPFGNRFNPLYTNSYEKISLPSPPPSRFSTNAARLWSRKQKMKVSHYFRMQEKLIKSKLSQNVTS